MKKALFLFFALVVCLHLQAEVQAEELRISVMDQDLGIPLEGVTISLSGITNAVSTDENGEASLSVPENFAGGILTATLPGYQDLKSVVKKGQNEIELTMTIGEVIEGQELVVERSAPGKTDAESGVSVAMNKTEMKTTSEIGLIEDVMASVKTLPGVTYSGMWSGTPSIRGGYPEEMGTTFDGIYIIYPWHWGGGYSIFDPLMVDSTKLSHGVFSSRYGRAMSGLLEVTSVKPSSTDVRIDAGIGTSSCNFFAQIPFSEKASLFAGGKITWLESVAWLYDGLGIEPKLSDTVPTMPYIRDFFAKGYYTPTPELELTFTGFTGTDGIGISADETNDGLTVSEDFNYNYLQGFVGTNMRWMPNDTTLVHGLAAYHYYAINMDYDMSYKGWKDYSDDFLTTYDSLDGTTDGTINGATGYSIDFLSSTGESVEKTSQGQGKLESDIQIADGHMISFGVEEVAQFFQADQSVNSWLTSYNEDNDLVLNPAEYELEREGNTIFNTAAFALWDFGSEASPIRGELGIRGEHFYLKNNTFDLNTYPVADPRFSIHWTPIRNHSIFDAVTFTSGTGLFSMFPSNSIAADKDMGIDDFEVGPNHAVYQVLGAELDMQHDWSFQFETYYKYYFNRLYILTNTNTNPISYSAHTDGIGHVAGFDLMLQKKNGRYFDGYLSYSFVYAKYLNPATADYDDQTTTDGDPVEIWYYPDFHRFHTLNLVTNWKPVSGMTITMKAALASGTPKEKVGDVTMYPVSLSDGSIMELYSRTSSYSDTLRNGISLPIDLRISQSGYYRGTKIRWEYYFGIENILATVYRASSNTSYDSFSGTERSGSADFSIGYPIPSLGYKISY